MSSIAGTLILADWQSLQGPDPCSNLQYSNCSDLNDSIETDVYSFTIFRPDMKGSHTIEISNVDTKTLMSCSSNCENRQETCNLLIEISKTIRVSMGESVCLWDHTLSCYQPMSQQYYELDPDQILETYYELITEQEGRSSYITNEGKLNDYILVILNQTQPVCSNRNKWSECNNETTTKQYLCEQSSDEYQCFWNPSSRITGQYCEMCRPVCLSKEYSLPFLQLIIGVVFVAPGYPLGRIGLTLLVSDGLGKASQVSIN